MIMAARGDYTITITCKPLLLIVESDEIADAAVLCKFDLNPAEKLKEPRAGKTCSNRQS